MAGKELHGFWINQGVKCRINVNVSLDGCSFNCWLPHFNDFLFSFTDCLCCLQKENRQRPKTTVLAFKDFHFQATTYKGCTWIKYELPFCEGLSRFCGLMWFFIISSKLFKKKKNLDIQTMNKECGTEFKVRPHTTYKST